MRNNGRDYSYKKNKLITDLVDLFRKIITNLQITVKVYDRWLISVSKHQTIYIYIELLHRWFQNRPSENTSKIAVLHHMVCIDCVGLCCPRRKTENGKVWWRNCLNYSSKEKSNEVCCRNCQKLFKRNNENKSSQRLPYMLVCQQQWKPC